MSKLPWTPWHEVARIRDDLKSGELSLAMFAADLHGVAMKKGERPIYEDPAQFFALTYPTYNLRQLAKDVVLRLAGKNDKAVRQLELTYGGGKTHTLITLHHLVNDPALLPDLPAVQEFIQHIGMTPPRARVSVLVFDRLDPETGMEVRGPQGEAVRFKYPWSVLAFQLGGNEGLKILGSTDGSERETPPFTNVLEELLRLPQKEDLSTLILMDEVLMWARTKVGEDPVWRHRLQDFFQCLTQAATQVDRCAIVASLLATDPHKSDSLGKELTQELYAVFQREREESVQPVLKEDVAEVLRRRFFKPESIRDREAFRPHVVAALKGIAEMDEQTRKDGKLAEDRFLMSYPFHPELTEVFYAKWTGLESFQRTRGILRTFALALRDAEKWDTCPMIAANVFLSAPDAPDISEAARELTTVAATEEYEGKRQEWKAILEGELAKAREIQAEATGLKSREVEQAVFATFLHSQPIGQRALTRDLLLLLGHTRPDKIEMEKALLRWTDTSWFLDEAFISDAELSQEGKRRLPKSWRLGSRPNLKQMHHDACLRVSPELVEAKLIEETGRLKSLTSGASGAGAKAHLLPEKPRDIEDDGEFHYAVLGPKAASDSGKPSAEARRFIDETTGPDRPRVYRNVVALAVPSKDGLEAARAQIKDYLGWEEVRAQLSKEHEVDPIREATLNTYCDAAKKNIPGVIQQAYCIVVTVSEKNEVQAFKLTVGSDPLFRQIKDDSRSRIQDTAISAEALLPEGPYDLWQEGESSRRVKDLVGAFAQFPHLPKMLNRKAILDTLVIGCIEGRFALRLARPDRSIRTFWRQQPDEAALSDPGLEVVLPEEAALNEIATTLLVPGALPDLWTDPEITFKQLCEYFSGKHVVKIEREGYDEPMMIPKAEQEVVERAVSSAVKEGRLWLRCGLTSIFAEDVPAGIITGEVVLQAPPRPVLPMEILPENLPDAWEDGITNAMAVSNALSEKAGKPLPWSTVREAIEGAFRARWLELSSESGAWPCDYASSQNALLRLPVKSPGVPIPPPPPPPKAGVRIAESELKWNQIQDLADAMGELMSIAAGYDLKFRLRIELGAESPPPEEIVRKVNDLLKDVSDDLQLSYSGLQLSEQV